MLPVDIERNFSTHISEQVLLKFGGFPVQGGISDIGREFTKALGEKISLMSPGKIEAIVDIAKVQLIRINKIPAGPAPEEFRREWVGLTLPALTDDAIDRVVEEVDFTDGGVEGRREIFLVETLWAVAILGATSPMVASWFINNCPEKMRHFTFGRHEAQVIGPGLVIEFKDPLAVEIVTLPEEDE